VYGRDIFTLITLTRNRGRGQSLAQIGQGYGRLDCKLVMCGLYVSMRNGRPVDHRPPERKSDRPSASGSDEPAGGVEEVVLAGLLVVCVAMGVGVALVTST